MSPRHDDIGSRHGHYASSMTFLVFFLLVSLMESCPAIEPSQWLLDAASSDAVLSVDANAQDSNKESVVERFITLPILSGTDGEMSAEGMISDGAIPQAGPRTLASIERKNTR